METKKHMHNNHLYHDVEKIKKSLAAAAYDVKDKAGDVFSEAIDAAAEKGEELQKKVSTYTAKKPLQSLGFALLAGAIIGYWFRK